jgi:serine/threonine protein kinase
VHRIRWGDIPDHIKAEIEALAGSRVIAADHREGGYSPCLAAALHLANGQTVFVKAVSSGHNPDSPDFVRQEIRVLGQMPASVPSTRLIGSYDDGDWVVIMIEHIDGGLPTIPWTHDQLSRALDSVAALGETAAPAFLPSASAFLGGLFDRWQQLVAADAVPDAWRDQADDLVVLEQRSLALIDGDRLVHNDIRHDNMLVTTRGDVRIIDWPYACRGAPWLDLVLWLPALQLEGGGAPADVLGSLDAQRRPPHDALRAVVAACTGYFVHAGQLPDPPGLPTVRAFQRAQAETAGAWLRQLLDQ